MSEKLALAIIGGSGLYVFDDQLGFQGGLKGNLEGPRQNVVSPSSRIGNDYSNRSIGEFCRNPRDRNPERPNHA